MKRTNSRRSDMSLGTDIFADLYNPKIDPITVKRIKMKMAICVLVMTEAPNAGVQRRRTAPNEGRPLARFPQHITF
jgi:hypothetical protein